MFEVRGGRGGGSLLSNYYLWPTVHQKEFLTLSNLGDLAKHRFLIVLISENSRLRVSRIWRM